MGYDEPEILPSSTNPICLMSVDEGHSRIMVSNLYPALNDHGFDGLVMKVFGLPMQNFVNFSISSDLINKRGR